MTREEAIEFIARSVKSDVDMALVADAIKALEQEPNEVCDWFKQYIDIPSNTVLIEFSDGTSKRVKRGEYLANVENDLRRMMQVQIERESYEDAIRPKGQWIEEFNDTEGEVRFTCSSCGKYQLFETDYCYNCGSDNREV